jgi:esterase/lipase superfamily enzyme
MRVWSASRMGILALFLGIPLAGCAGLADTASLRSTPNGLSPIEAEPRLSVVTTRKPVDDAAAEPWFGSERGTQMSVAQVRLASPAQAGRFSLAAAGLVDWRISRVDIVPNLVLGDGDVLLYIHGFNQTFETATLDAARLADGLRFGGETVLFSWPSRNKLFDYIADRESATWSRDALETTLDSLVARPGLGRVNIVAHSMGAMLAIEGLRQAYAKHGERLLDRIGAIILAAPDLDMDVFSASIARMRPLATRITVITSNDDRALAVVTSLSGGARVGRAQKAKLQAYGLKVIDTSGAGWGIINHDLFLSDSAVQKVIARAIASGKG